MKTSIDERSKLKDAFKKIESVKKLERDGSMKIIGPGTFGGELENDRYIDQIFGFIFTSDSLTLENLTNEYLELLFEKERNLWPNYYCDYNKIAMGYYGQETHGGDTMDAEGLSKIESEEINFGAFYAVLNQHLRHARIGWPNSIKYFGLDGVSVQTFSFEGHPNL